MEQEQRTGKGLLHDQEFIDQAEDYIAGDLLVDNACQPDMMGLTRFLRGCVQSIRAAERERIRKAVYGLRTYKKYSVRTEPGPVPYFDVVEREAVLDLINSPETHA